MGDPKQSIYRFRRADVALYEATKQKLVAAGAEVIHLTTSFRSVPSIQEAVNRAFEPLMRGNADGSQAEYVPLRPSRAEPQGRPTIVALPVPRPYSDWGKLVKFKIEDSIPDAVGAFVEFLINQSGFTITERERPNEKVRSRRATCVCCSSDFSSSAKTSPALTSSPRGASPPSCAGRRALVSRA